MEIKEIVCKSALVKSNLPDTDYVINPYTGCEIGCVYCYASFMCRFIGKDFSQWGYFLQPKINIVEILKKELNSKKIDKTKSIFISSVTDPYTYSEQRYKLTRSILQELIDSHWTGRISVQSKNPLITRDIDLFSKLENIEIGMTITSDNNAESRVLENRAPLVELRLQALDTLQKAGLKTYAFIGPLLPSYMNSFDKLESLIKTLKEYGVQEVYIEFMNLQTNKEEIYQQISKNQGSKVADDYFKKLKNNSLLNEYNSSIVKILEKYDIRLKCNEVIKHGIK